MYNVYIYTYIHMYINRNACRHIHTYGRNWDGEAEAPPTLG